MIALLGNLSFDYFSGQPPRAGGGPFHAARALHQLEAPARIYARCAVEDREALVLPVVRLGTPVQYVPGELTTSFQIAYRGNERLMSVRSVGDTWLPADVPQLPDETRWVHVAPLLRSDFPPETLALLARGGRRVLLDGQGLVRVSAEGPLRLDDGYDPELLRHVWALKLSDEEAELVGNPAALGVREVLVTHGVRGSTVYVDGRAEGVGAWSVEADPTGAGDAFSVAYVAARESGFPPVAAARRATSVVADVLAAA